MAAKGYTELYDVPVTIQVVAKLQYDYQFKIWDWSIRMERHEWLSQRGYGCLASGSSYEKPIAVRKLNDALAKLGAIRPASESGIGNEVAPLSEPQKESGTPKSGEGDER